MLFRSPKHRSFSFSIIPSKEHPGLISFRMDWLDLLTVQGTLKSSPIPQFKSINSLALSFLYSPTRTYIITGKTIALTRPTFVGKVVSLLLNMLSRLVITFLPRSKHLLISWLQSSSAVILEPPKIKSDIDNSKPVFFNWVPHFNKRREIIKYSLNFPKNSYINSTISCLGKLIYQQQQIS